MHSLTHLVGQPVTHNHPSQQSEVVKQSPLAPYFVEDTMLVEIEVYDM